MPTFCAPAPRAFQAFPPEPTHGGVYYVGNLARDRARNAALDGLARRLLGRAERGQVELVQRLLGRTRAGNIYEYRWRPNPPARKGRGDGA